MTKTIVQLIKPSLILHSKVTQVQIVLVNPRKWRDPCREKHKTPPNRARRHCWGSRWWWWLPLLPLLGPGNRRLRLKCTERQHSSNRYQRPELKSCDRNRQVRPLFRQWPRPDDRLVRPCGWHAWRVTCSPLWSSPGPWHSHSARGTLSAVRRQLHDELHRRHRHHQAACCLLRWQLHRIQASLCLPVWRVRLFISSEKSQKNLPKSDAIAQAYLSETRQRADILHVCRRLKRNIQIVELVKKFIFNTAHTVKAILIFRLNRDNNVSKWHFFHQRHRNGINL